MSLLLRPPPARPRPSPVTLTAVDGVVMRTGTAPGDEMGACSLHRSPSRSYLSH